MVTGDLSSFKPHTLPPEYSPINVDLALAKDGQIPQSMPYIPHSRLVEQCLQQNSYIIDNAALCLLLALRLA